MRFGFVVLHYLIPDVTAACVDRLLHLRASDLRVVIVDNASPDGSGEELAEHFQSEERVEIVFSKENLGYARGCNLGVSTIRSLFDPDYVIVLNNDVMIEDPGFPEKIDASYRRKPFGVLGPDIFCPKTGVHQSPSHLHVPTYEDLQKILEQPKTPMPKKKSFQLPYRKRFFRQSSQKVSSPQGPAVWQKEWNNPVLHGACCIFSRDFFSVRENAFSPRTFLYMEEDFLAYESLRDGISLRYDPSLRVHHLDDCSTDAAFPAAGDKLQMKQREKEKSVRLLMDQIQEDREAIIQRGELLPEEVPFSCERIGDAFAGNSVNGSIFRKNAIVSHFTADGICFQFCCFYDARAHIMIAKREGHPAGSGSFPDSRAQSYHFTEWTLCDTGLANDYSDSHNALSLAVDGDGFLHLLRCEHNGALFYARGDEPLSMCLHYVPAWPDTSVTYPEFYLHPSGDLFLLFRTGRSGSGKLVLHRYFTREKKWLLLRNDLAKGEGSPYWQACMDKKGRLHISYVWRRTSDAATNHDLYYICACDDTGDTFTDPVLVKKIPEGSGLINQTSMTADDTGNPAIAVLCRNRGVLQYLLFAKKQESWICYDTGIRAGDFVPEGRGTRRFPCGRPLVLSLVGSDREFLLITRDDEDGGRLAARKILLPDNESTPPVSDPVFLTAASCGSLEPCFDPVLWDREKMLTLFAHYECHAPDRRLWITAGSPAFSVSARPDELFPGGETGSSAGRDREKEERS